MRNYTNMCYEEIIEFICNNRKCVLSVAENNAPYSIPMCYTAYQECDQIYLVMKSRECGKKMNCLRHNKKVSVVIERYGIFGAYKSVVLSGKAEIIDNCNCPCNDEVTIKITIESACGRKYC